ncbi:MAG: hypothetical protein AAGC46_03315 [Solirubrobacteraceae bacterium]|nr:hypothetical protein [Patulibacter sp.]
MTRHDSDQTSALARYLDTFGQRYADATRADRDAEVPADRSPRRRVRFIPAAGVGGVIAAGVLAYVVVASPLGDHVDAVTAASAALGQNGDIVHYTAVIDEGTPSEGIPEHCTSIGSVSEVWQTESGPTHWHQVTPGRSLPADCARFALGPDGRMVTGTVEFAQHGGVTQSYFHDLRLLTTYHGTAGKPTGATVIGGTVGGDSRDFVTFLRGMLRSGKMRVVGGEHEAYGRRALSLEARSFTHKDADAHHPNLDMTNVTTFVVDATTFTPLHLDQTDTYVRDAGKYKGSITNSYGMRFTNYERLPRTPENEKLLDIQPDQPTRDRLPDAEKTPQQRKIEEQVARYQREHPVETKTR